MLRPRPGPHELPASESHPLLVAGRLALGGAFTPGYKSLGVAWTALAARYSKYSITVYTVHYGPLVIGQYIFESPRLTRLGRPSCWRHLEGSVREHAPKVVGGPRSSTRDSWHVLADQTRPDDEPTTPQVDSRALPARQPQAAERRLHHPYTDVRLGPASGTAIECRETWHTSGYQETAGPEGASPGCISWSHSCSST